MAQDFVKLAEITKLNYPEASKVLPKPLYEKISKSRQMLLQSKVKPTREPQPVTLYNKNVQVGPLGAV